MSEPQAGGARPPSSPSPAGETLRGPVPPAGQAPPSAAGPSAGERSPAGPAEAPLPGRVPSGRVPWAGGLPPFDVRELLWRQLAEMDEPVELTAAQVAALPLAGAGDGPPPGVDEVPWWLDEDLVGSAEAEQAAWVRGLPADIAAAWRDEPRSDDLPGAGFTHRDAGVGPRPEAGFAAGGVLDVALPGPVLAAGIDAAASRGAGLGESELIGVLCGWQRLASWAQAGLAGCVNVLVERRMEQSVALRQPALAGHVDAEVAAALALTGQAAGRLLAVSTGLGRLPGVAAALAAGRVDWAKAALFTDGLAGLPGEAANDIAGAVLEGAESRTAGQLRAALARAVLAWDPQAAERKRQDALKDASVQSWAEGSGNSCLAGRELAPADVIEASARLTGHARWLRAHGAAGSTDQLRAAAYIALLTGQPLHSLLPEPAGDSTSPGDSVGAGNGPGPQSSAGPDSAGPDSAGPDSAGPDSAGPDSAGADGGGRLGGVINLTMPLSAWLGWSQAPGEVAGHGPADAGTCRDLASRLGPAARWCLTLTGPDGRAAAHACAPRPPAAGTPAITWADGLRARLQYLQAGACSHPRRASAYRPPPSLAHLIRVRQRTCSFPGCRRPARRADLDHTVPWQHGGDTCECNLAPLCRRHHQAKQAHGWHLTQDQPGILTWRTPSGRTYTVTPEPYPV